MHAKHRRVSVHSRHNACAEAALVGRTTGFLAVGFSPIGSMVGSDIVMVWMDDETLQAVVTDRQAIAHDVPRE